MKKHWLLSAAMLALVYTGAIAADDAATVPATPAAAPAAATGGKHYHARTLEEARKYAHARADKLDKMTEAEYAAQQQKRHDMREKWKHMTPEEKAAYKKAKYEKRHPKDAASAPATPAASAPANGGQ